MKTFKEALRTRDFTISAELKLDATSTRASIAGEARNLAPMIDAIQVTDNPGGRAHLSPLVAAACLLENDVDPVLHMSCRDRNRIAIRSDLIGAAELGVTSLLLMRGRKFPDDFPAKPKAVFDWGANKLIAAARAFETGPDAAGTPQFFLGSIATAFNPKRGWTPRKMSAKADAGIKFIQTQPCFDIDVIRRYMAGLVAARLPERVSVVAGVAPIPSAEIGEWLAVNLRGAVVPKSVIERLRRAADPRREGIEICAELLAQLADVPGVSGANLMSFGDTTSVLRSIERSGIRHRSA